jgi:phosphoenolpyruvate carboxylase
LDIRQNSKIHDEVFKDVYDFYINWLQMYFRRTTIFSFPKLKESNPADFTNEITRSTIESIKQLKIQENNGELGANRYIISNNESALNVMETLQ